MNQILNKAVTVFAVGFALFAGAAEASVVVAGTRIIFPSQEREVTIKVSNEGTVPALVQTWLDKGEANVSPDNIDVPFTLTPVMFRLDPKKGQTLRLIHSKQPLREDKETLFWLNVLEIPPKPTAGSGDANQLQLALRTRIKVLFRPEGLEGKAADAPARVVWALLPVGDGKSYQLKASNPTPFHVNLGSMSLTAGVAVFDAGAGYIAPGESAVFPVEGLTTPPIAMMQVEYNAINDFGGGVIGKATLRSGPAH